MNEKLVQLLAGIDPNDISAFDKAIQQHFQYLTENYSELDPEAKIAVDEFSEELLKQAKENLSAMPDSQRKREGLRIVKKADGRHFDSKFLVEILEKKSDKNLEIITDTRGIFVRRLQTILDLLSDATDKTQKGIAGFARLSLLYLCIDELLAAFHLAQHFFVSQAYSHIRTVWEALDKVELFHQQPEWAILWSSQDPNDEHKILHELSPAFVRQKLGKNRYDPLYSMFSELGPHGSFKGIQSRTTQKAKTDEDERPQFRIWVGGCPFVHNIVWVNSFLIYTLVMVILKIASVYQPDLTDRELNNILTETKKEIRNFILKHYVGWLKEVGFDPDPLIKIMDGPDWTDG